MKNEVKKEGRKEGRRGGRWLRVFDVVQYCLASLWRVIGVRRRPGEEWGRL